MTASEIARIEQLEADLKAFRSQVFRVAETVRSIQKYVKQAQGHLEKDDLNGPGKEDRDASK